MWAGIGKTLLGIFGTTIIIVGFIQALQENPQYNDPNYISPEAGAVLFVVFIVCVCILISGIEDIIKCRRERTKTLNRPVK